MNKKILQLAIPNIISNITIPLLGIVDLAITGHLESNVYVGAIAIGAMVFNIIYWAFGFLRMGVTGLTAQAYGAKDNPEVTSILFRGLIVSVLGALLLITFQIPIEKLVFWLIDGSSEVELFAREYFYIRIWAAPATISLYVFSGWFIGMQNTKIPMIIALLINALNIILNLVFVKYFGMKSDGVALGTVIAQYAGLSAGVIFFVVKYKPYLKFLDWIKVFKREQLVYFVKVNKDIFIRTVSLLAVFTFFTSQSASVDDNVLAANTLLLQFLFIFSFLADGFAYAAEALIGKYYGQKNLIKINRAVKLSFLWGGFIAIIFTVLYGLGSTTLLKMLTNQEQIINISNQYKFWVVIIPIASVGSFIWDGVFVGLTTTKEMRNSMLIAAFVIFFPIWFIFSDKLQNHALWLAFILFLLARGAAQTVMYFRNIKKELESKIA